MVPDILISPYFLQAVLIAFNIWMAKYHAAMLKRDKYPKHGWWGLLYLLVTGLFCFISGSWVLAIVSLLLRKVVFDAALNLYNNRPLFFVSTETSSIIDKIHYKLFGNRSEIYMLIYLVALIFINIFFL